MPLIDYDADIHALWAAVAAEEPYAQSASDFPARYNGDISEERILIMLDVMRAYLETLTERQELQRFHHAVSRMLGEVAYNRVYDDLGARVLGNVAVALPTAGTETLGVDVIDPLGAVVTTAAVAVAASATPALLVTNCDAVLPAEVESYVENGKLGFRLTAAGEAAGSTFTLLGTLPALAGVQPGPHAIPVRAAARRARDKGLDHYNKEIRADDSGVFTP